MKRSNIALFALTMFALTACDDPYAPTMRPTYVIGVEHTPQGSVAVPPPCPNWATDNADPYDNQPLPQFGCAAARNLAAMVENPDDLVEGRPLGQARGVTAVGSIRRYDNNQTRGLITPDSETSQVASTTATTASSSMTGDVTGSASSTASPAAAAAGP